jgi:hypothetical protein
VRLSVKGSCVVHNSYQFANPTAETVSNAECRCALTRIDTEQSQGVSPLCVNMCLYLPKTLLMLCNRFTTCSTRRS